MGMKKDATHVANFKSGRKFGFTLAEVLVTLGIIGVVSAMTIPSLTQNWQKRAYVTQLHKAYSEIHQAFINRMNQRSAVNLMEAGLVMAAGNEGEFAREQFKVIKDCGESTTPCFADSYRSLDGQTISNLGGFKSCIVNGSGVAICMIVSSGITTEQENEGYLGRMIVDINGPKGPNIRGRDLFDMYFYPDGSLDAKGTSIDCKKYGKNCYGTTPKQNRDNAFTYYCKSIGTSDYGGCFGKILNDNWEMKY